MFYEGLQLTGPFMLESDRLYLKSTNLNVNLIQKHLHRNIQNNVWSAICGPAKLTHKINHHTLLFNDRNLFSLLPLPWLHTAPSDLWTFALLLGYFPSLEISNWRTDETKWTKLFSNEQLIFLTKTISIIRAVYTCIKIIVDTTVANGNHTGL